ncbi:hypothetical protein [Stutzerimonas xanthomarina]|uniref:hypothetical protein n=1 Tax=Stutzerimonas xanthomarina TaxID=271420 RepID=UPI003AA7EA15
MDDRIIKSINAFSEAMRARAPEKFSFDLFSMFPFCCCEFASLLLGRYLYEEHNEIAINVITGELKENPDQRHIWLKIKTRNIDLTANQFDKYLPEVLITRRGGWHDQYKIIKNTRFNDEFDADFWHETKREMRADYKFLSCKARGSSPNKRSNRSLRSLGLAKASP